MLTDQQHPITPPPELVQQWVAEIWHEGTPVRVSLSDEHLASRAAQWGADRELEACIHWLITGPYGASIACNADHMIGDLRAARRPKPPSLAEQATAELDIAVIRGDCITTSDAIPSLRAALKRLQELESNG